MTRKGYRQQRLDPAGAPGVMLPSCKLPAATVAAIRHQAEKRDTSVSAVIREALQMYLAHPQTPVSDRQ